MSVFKAKKIIKQFKKCLNLDTNDKYYLFLINQLANLGFMTTEIHCTDPGFIVKRAIVYNQQYSNADRYSFNPNTDSINLNRCNRSKQALFYGSPILDPLPFEISVDTDNKMYVGD